MSASSAATAPEAALKTYLVGALSGIVLMLGAGVLFGLAGTSTSGVTVALPLLADGLGVDTAVATWMVSGYAVALAVATLSVRTASGGGNLLMVVGLQMLVGAIALAPFALALEPFEVNWNPGLIAAFAYTTLVPGLAATWVWFELVQRIGAVRAATFHFLNPFFGVAIAAVLLGEQLGLLDVIGVAVVTVGILAVQLSKQKPAPVTADRAST